MFTSPIQHFLLHQTQALTDQQQLQHFDFIFNEQQQVHHYLFFNTHSLVSKIFYSQSFAREFEPISEL